MNVRTSIGRSIRQTHRVVALLALFVWAAAFSSALLAQDDAEETASQEDQPKSLIEREPFDRITLDARNQNKVYEVQPLPFPGRRVPDEGARKGFLQFVRVKKPKVKLEVPWSRVVSVELYEEMIYKEAERLISEWRNDESKLDQAYEYYSYLLEHYPKTPGLERSMQLYLNEDIFRSVSAGDKAIKDDRAEQAKKHYQEALAVAEELYARNPGFFGPSSTPIGDMLAQIFDRLLSAYVENNRNYLAARRFMERIEEQYTEAKTQETVNKWRGRLIELAESRREDAKRQMAAGNGRAAHNAMRELRNIWPTLAGSDDLAVEVQNRFPLIMVGVTQPALDAEPLSMDDWGARRVGQITRRLLMEFSQFGLEGGQYVCPLGTYEQHPDDQRLLKFTVRPSGARADAPSLTVFELSARLLDLADPESPDYLETWRRMLASVSVPAVDTVEIELNHVYVLPDALLQTPLQPPEQRTQGLADGIYVIDESKRQKDELTYIPNPRYKLDASIKRPEIVERVFEDSQAALAALRRGEVDLVDRIFPADVKELQNDPLIEVGRYEVPSVHMLIPLSDGPFVENQAFRRSLAFAIDRELILTRLLLGDQEIPGCRVVSGPCPPGISEADSFSYAYDPGIDPLPADRVLAKTMLAVTENQLTKAALRKNEEPPKRSTITIAHPASEIARIACQQIAAQLRAVEVDCKLLELPPGVTRATKEQCDFLYAEILMWEPLLDARRLIGPNGLVGSTNQYILLALRRLDTAENWTEARQQFARLHSIVHETMTVIPLWQLVEHYARRKELTGMADRRVSLYQDVTQWQVVPRRNQE